MKLLQEILAGVRRMDDEDFDVSLDVEDTPPEVESDINLDSDADPEDVSLDVPGDDLETDLGGEEHPELDGIVNDAIEDPDHQGLIRTIKNAHLVYKRETEDGSFEELWIYNLTTLHDELDTRKAILAGTDIPTGKLTSPDGSQTYHAWSAGNAEMILIQGLPN